MRETLPFAATDAAARRAIGRTLAAAGCLVRCEGDSLVVHGPLAGRVAVAGSKASFDVTLRGRLLARIVTSALIGAGSSLAIAIWCGWMFHRALPLGAVSALAYAGLGIVRDRVELRRRLRALVASLPILVDE